MLLSKLSNIKKPSQSTGLFSYITNGFSMSERSVSFKLNYSSWEGILKTSLGYLAAFLI
jgi:hypothetical protein